MTTNEIAAAIAKDIKATISDRKMRVKVWTGTNVARVYTGIGGDYIEIDADGVATMSRERMAWSHKIAPIVEAHTA